MTNKLEPSLPYPPQEIASNIDVYAEVGDKTFISCHDGQHPGFSKLRALTPRFYEVLSWTAQGLSQNNGIPQIISKSPRTVRNYMQFLKQDLGFVSTQEAVLLIPIDEAELRKVCLYKPVRNGTIKPKLSPRQQVVWDAMGEGKNNDQIRHELALSATSLRTHRSEIYKRLGISTEQETFENFKAPRMAIGLANLKIYAGKVRCFAESIQPLIINAIEDIDDFARHNTIDPRRIPIAEDVDPALLRVMQKKEFISDHEIAAGQTELLGSIALNLYCNSEAAAIIEANPGMHKALKEIIKGETGVYIRYISRKNNQAA